MEELIFWLRQVSRPDRAWLAIERELMNDSEANRQLGSVTMLAGAILKAVPQDQDKILQIQSLAQYAWDFYQKKYRGDLGVFNDHRLQLRSAVNGLLSSGMGRPSSPDSMVKRNKAWSMPKQNWDWLESQPNQSQTLRKAIESLMEKSENE